VRISSEWARGEWVRIGPASAQFAPRAGPLVKIYGAITFYLENKEQMGAYLEEQDRRWEALSQELVNRPDPLRDRLREANQI